MTVAGAHFPTLCRQWRRARHLSQLQLAETAAISQRHLSWLETGRSRPSREMVVRLAEALEIPLRERNTLLNAAGFAPLYRESTLDEPHMAPIREALTRVLEHHHPYPALVVDRKWNWVMGNPAAELLLGLSGTPMEAESDGTPFNLAAATLAPQGLRRFIHNAETALPLFVQRLRSEAVASGDPALISHIEGLLRNAGAMPEHSSLQSPLLPVIPLELDIDGLRLSLFTVLSTFGTPQDITTDELRIEAFYPSDEDTRRFFSEAAGK